MFKNNSSQITVCGSVSTLMFSEAKLTTLGLEMDLNWKHLDSVQDPRLLDQCYKVFSTNLYIFQFIIRNNIAYCRRTSHVNDLTHTFNPLRESTLPILDCIEFILYCWCFLVMQLRLSSGCWPGDSLLSIFKP